MMLNITNIKILLILTASYKEYSQDGQEVRLAQWNFLCKDIYISLL